MDKDILWAPWRLGYIQQADDSAARPELPTLPAGADASCFMCRAIHGSQDHDALVVARGDASIALLNRYPYSNGHLLVAPLRHVGELPQLIDAEHLSLQRQIAQLIEVLSQQIQAEGFNVGLNLGRVAGAGVPGHLHWHIVPRWSGDNNFMPTLAGTRVIPQSLDALWEILTRAMP